MEAVRGMFGDLLTGCCQNRPDICLGTTTRADGPMNVLFVCTGNSARSIMAEAILRAEGEGRFNTFSAGTAPSDAPNAQALKLLETKGYDITPLRSKSITEFFHASAPKMDFVFTVCDHAANEDCPTWPGHPMSGHWGVPDPVAASPENESAFQKAFDLLRQRVLEFAKLPFDTIDAVALQHQIDDISRLDQVSSVA